VANPNATLAAFKAMPGASSRTLSPQGSNAPGIGHVSPLVAQLANERGYANSYGPFLPRTPRTFTEGAFGPFSPILPVPVDQPAEGAELPDARLYEYMVGWNLPVGQPGTEGIKLADFGTLKTLADLYSVARACIELRKNEIVGLDWDIIPTKDAAKAYHGSNSAMRDFGNRRGQALKFFEKPDPDYNSFQTFLSSLLEEVFVFDALSLLIRPKRGKGLKRGVLGSDLDCLELISGPTMRPLRGMHGETPRPPNPAYQQYLYGVPRSDYMTMITQRDIDEFGLTGAEVNNWTNDQFLYLPMVPRRWTPYGFPPVERALIPVMSGLQKQAFQLDYFKEGTIPAVYVSPGDVNMTPNQIRELQDALNAFAGDPAWHHKVIVLPPGSKVDPQKAVDVADQFDDVVMTQVCMAFDVNPMELGILPKVAATASPSQIKQMAQGAASVHERLSTKPLLKFLADIFDSILHNVLHQDDMKFTFEGLQEDAEQGMLTDLLVQQVQSGLRSVDEARDALELQPWGLPMTSGPVVFTAAGPMPFDMPPMPATPGQSQGGQQNAGARASVRQAPTAGPAPIQQAGRQGGQPAPTPGHAAAAAANSAVRSGRAPTISAPATGSVSAQKFSPAAITSELDALVRHLNKGRRITTWQPRYITGHSLAVISEDLAKGLSPEQCADIAKTIMLGPGEFEWLPKGQARREPSWTSLSERYSPLIQHALDVAVTDITVLVEDWWNGRIVLTRESLLDHIAEVIREALRPVLMDLWADAWRVSDDTAGGYFEAWAASHGRDALENIATSRRKPVAAAIQAAVASGRGADAVTGQLPSLLDIGNRADMIAVTEMGRAATDAAQRKFVSTGVTFKEWVTADDGRVCPECMLAQDEGPVPLDSLFSNGLMGPPAHPRCRCDLIPSMTVKVGPQPEQDLHPGEHHVTCDRGHEHWGEHGAAGVLLRCKGDDGKIRYLLQKRSPGEDDPGTWSLPGGALLQGETVEQGAFREAQEEMGNFPPDVQVHHHVTDDHGGWAFTTVICDVPQSFAPSVDGESPFETDGWGWFTKEEIKDLALHPGFKDSWESVVRSRKNIAVGKCAIRRVNLDGQQFWEQPDLCPHGTGDQAAGGGGPEFMAHDAEGIQHGRASGSRGGGTSGHIDDAGSVVNDTTSPEWEDDSEYPQHRGVPPHQGGGPQGYMGGFWPQGGHGTQQAPTAEIGATAPRGTGAGNGSLARPKKKNKNDKAAVVYAQMEGNFPDDAIQWVKECHWDGPLDIPLDDIDWRDRKQWAAWHEQDHVDDFKRKLQAGEEINPPVLVHHPGKMAAVIIDGHHRSLAYQELGMPVRGWLGEIPEHFIQAALETHSSQDSQGSSGSND
jgi:8-oxo-dGTP pyrophosphatase MutT (NUDIX family)